MRTIRRICAVALLTAAFSTFAFADGEGWIGTGYKPTGTKPVATKPILFESCEAQELNIAETGEETSYFDELYEATLLFLQMNLL